MTEISKFVVALTGGIASGKSTVANFFKELGIAVVSADIVAHDLMQADSELVKKIDSVFQAEFKQDSLLNEEGVLDRSALRDIIFNSDTARRKLNELTHPAIGFELIKRMQMADSDYVIAEIPLLIEANMQGLANRILVVETTTNTQLERIMQRDQVNLEQAQKVLNAQLSNQQRRAYADDIIQNNKKIDKLKNSVKLLNQTYLKLAREPGTNTSLTLS